jgi:hypothetical protein
MEAEPFVPESYDVEETGLVLSDGVYYELRKSPDVAEARVMPLHTPIWSEKLEHYVVRAELDIPEEVRLNDRLVFKVTEIADRAFAYYNDCGAENLFQTVNVAGSVRRIGSGAFYGCSYLTTVNLSEGLKEIGDAAFSGCSSLKELKLPASLEQIGSSVFGECSWLKTIYCYAVTPPSCTEDSFDFENKETAVFYVPKGCREAYEASPGWNSVTIREIGDETGISSPVIYEYDRLSWYDLLGRRLVKTTPGKIIIKNKQKILTKSDM